MDENALYNLYNIRESTVDRLECLGFKNLDDITNVDIKGFILKTGFKHDTAKRIYLNAKAIQEKKIFLLKTLEFDEKDVGYIDIEIGGSRNEGAMIFLLSCFQTEPKKVKQFFAKNNILREEKRILIEFLKYLEKNKIQKLYCYSKIKFDFRWLIKRVEAHNLNRDGRYDYGFRLLKEGYDIYWIIKHHIVSPTTTMGLKELGIAFGFKWRHPEIGMHNIGGFYYDYIETKDRAIVKKMFEYNEDDVLVIEYIISKMKIMDVFDV